MIAVPSAEDGGMEISGNASVLILRYAQPADSGIYACSAKNIAGSKNGTRTVIVGSDLWQQVGYIRFPSYEFSSMPHYSTAESTSEDLGHYNPRYSGIGHHFALGGCILLQEKPGLKKLRHFIVRHI